MTGKNPFVIKVMSVAKSLAILFSIAIVSNQNVSAQVNNANEAKINALLKQMTLEEKVGQMAQVAIDVIGKTDYAHDTYILDQSKVEDVINNYKAGSILNTPGALLSAADWNA